MHPQQLIDTVVEFEKDLAAFYERLENADQHQELNKILNFMNKHSAIHAELIHNFRADASLPGLDLKPLETLHTKIKTALADQLLATDDVAVVFDSLAQAEAIISQVYTAMAAHFQKTADVYALLSQKFKNLADDEMQHHQYIQDEKTTLEDK